MSSVASGVRHRATFLSAVKAFADAHGYRTRLLWSASRGVAYCRYGDLFAKIAGIEVIDIDEPEAIRMERAAIEAGEVSFRGERLPCVASKVRPSARVFAYNLPASRLLLNLVEDRSKRDRSSFLLPVAAAYRAPVRRLCADHRFDRRVGIRIRVTEKLTDRRQPHRVRAELDSALLPVLRLPWSTKVFVVTDSEYVQQMLASHFVGAVYFEKSFDLAVGGSRYVSRLDSAAMRVFVTESECLRQCRRIINIGGFLNEHTVRPRWVVPPYDGVANIHEVRVL